MARSSCFPEGPWVTADGFVALVCTAPECRLGCDPDAVAETLLGDLPRHRFGVLVAAECTGAHEACRHRSPGTLVLVQPCDAARHPVAPALRVGPLRSTEDIAAFREWIAGGRFDADLLPRRLIDVARSC